MSKLIVGNWKMHGNAAMARSLAGAVAQAQGHAVLCPPAVLIPVVAAALSGSRVQFGAQDCHVAAEGAHTGDISAAMLHDAGCAYVIVGHSERRQAYGETDALVRRKAEAALAAGLTPIICVGETLAQRQAGEAEAVVSAQVKGSVPTMTKALPHLGGGLGGGGEPLSRNGSGGESPLPNPPPASGERGFNPEIILAYEPVWAIGSGLTPTTDDILRMHAAIHALLPAGTSVLYGGSVKASNTQEILHIPGVDGALVGGASLKAEEFLAIIRAANG